MKKYYRLFVLIVTVISTLGFFIYRTEYIRLRSVFEIGRLFGTDTFGESCLVLNQSVEDKTEYNNLFSHPSPQWIKINEFYVYSAFWRNLGDKSKSIALGVSSKENDFSEYNCHIWYHLRGSLFSVSGTFTFTSKMINNSTLFINEFFCEVTNESIKGLPYIFVFINKVQKKYFIPIYHKTKTEKLNNAAICVFPDYSGLERNYIIEFLSYHKSVGFSDVVVYDNGIQHGIITILGNIVFPNINFLRSFSALNWQFPFEDFEAQEEFIKLDCFYRVHNQVDFLTLLHWDEYIIPRKGKNILALFDHLGLNRSIQFSLEVQRCCTEMKNDKRAKLSWPVMLKKTLCIKQEMFRTAILNPNAFSNQHLENVTSSLAVINSYESCEMLKETEIIQDKTALKFIADLMSNELLRITRSGIFIKN